MSGKVQRTQIPKGGQSGGGGQGGGRSRGGRGRGQGGGGGRGRGQGGGGGQGGGQGGGGGRGAAGTGGDKKQTVDANNRAAYEAQFTRTYKLLTSRFYSEISSTVGDIRGEFADEVIANKLLLQFCLAFMPRNKRPLPEQLSYLSDIETSRSAKVATATAIYKMNGRIQDIWMENKDNEKLSARIPDSSQTSPDQKYKPFDRILTEFYAEFGEAYPYQEMNRRYTNTHPGATDLIKEAVGYRDNEEMEMLRILYMDAINLKKTNFVNFFRFVPNRKFTSPNIYRITYDKSSSSKKTLGKGLDTTPENGYDKESYEIIGLDDAYRFSFAFCYDDLPVTPFHLKSLNDAADKNIVFVPNTDDFRTAVTFDLNAFNLYFHDTRSYIKYRVSHMSDSIVGGIVVTPEKQVSLNLILGDVFLDPKVTTPGINDKITCVNNKNTNVLFSLRIFGIGRGNQGRVPLGLPGIVAPSVPGGSNILAPGGAINAPPSTQKISASDYPENTFIDVDKLMANPNETFLQHFGIQTGANNFFSDLKFPELFKAYTDAGYIRGPGIEKTGVFDYASMNFMIENLSNFFTIRSNLINDLYNFMTSIGQRINYIFGFNIGYTQIKKFVTDLINAKVPVHEIYGYITELANTTIFKYKTDPKITMIFPAARIIIASWYEFFYDRTPPLRAGAYILRLDYENKERNKIENIYRVMLYLGLDYNASYFQMDALEKTLIIFQKQADTHAEINVVVGANREVTKNDFNVNLDYYNYISKKIFTPLRIGYITNVEINELIKRDYQQVISVCSTKPRLFVICNRSNQFWKDKLTAYAKEIRYTGAVNGNISAKAELNRIYNLHENLKIGVEMDAYIYVNNTNTGNKITIKIPRKRITINKQEKDLENISNDELKSSDIFRTTYYNAVKEVFNQFVHNLIVEMDKRNVKLFEFSIRDIDNNLIFSSYAVEVQPAARLDYTKVALYVMRPFNLYTMLTRNGHYLILNQLG